MLEQTDVSPFYLHPSSLRGSPARRRSSSSPRRRSRTCCDAAPTAPSWTRRTRGPSSARRTSTRSSSAGPRPSPSSPRAEAPPSPRYAADFMTQRRPAAPMVTGGQGQMRLRMNVICRRLRAGQLCGFWEPDRHLPGRPQLLGQVGQEGRHRHGDGQRQSKEHPPRRPSLLPGFQSYFNR